MRQKNKFSTARTPEALARLLDLAPSTAREWKVQLALLHALRRILDREQLTHAEIAARARTSRTRITSILNGDLQHVTSDLLIRILSSLGYAVKVTVSRERKAA